MVVIVDGGADLVNGSDDGDDVGGYCVDGIGGGYSSGDADECLWRS